MELIFQLLLIHLVMCYIAHIKVTSFIITDNVHTFLVRLCYGAVHLLIGASVLQALLIGLLFLVASHYTLPFRILHFIAFHKEPWEEWRVVLKIHDLVSLWTTLTLIVSTVVFSISVNYFVMTIL